MKKRVEQFGALGQEDRLEIFRMLVRAGPQGNCVDDIKRRLKLPGSTLSHHLDALTRCGLLAAQRSGRFIYYAVNWREAANLIRFLAEDCCAEMHTRPARTAGSKLPDGRGGNQAPDCGKDRPAAPGIMRMRP
ncbi:MAG TPA: metalloregulator ArsR/SmtB family transcription factor [Candidatus Binataceae bacterium]|nr:metalloregulator ArsR/SmtB family transcription factor [Candidatus Binataceae bacterium]